MERGGTALICPKPDFSQGSSLVLIFGQKSFSGVGFFPFLFFGLFFGFK